MSAGLQLDRRSFVKLLGGGVAVFVTLGPSELLAQQSPGGAYPTDFNAYLRIGPDGRVTVFSGKIEMGQGVLTSQAQMAAEELGVALDKIDMLLGDTDLCPFDAGTWGSLTTRMFGPALRAAAADARAVLVQLASERLGVATARLTVEDGVVSVEGEPSRHVSYAELAKGQAIARTLDQRAVLRAASQFKVMGRSPKRLDGTAKVTGAAKYAADLRRPGMLYARILRPPAHGAVRAELDTSSAEALPGVTVVVQGDLVAVLHADPEVAEAALGHVRVKWSAAPPGADQDSIFEHLVSRAPAPDVREAKGNLDSAAARRFEHTYQKGYVAHAPLEPHAALAEFQDGKLTVWSSTQSPFGTRSQLAQALGLDTQRVRVITPFVGGGFGGKGSGRQAEEAARLAQATGKPVQVAFTRAEEFFYDTFDPAAVVKLTSGMDASGKLVLWDYDVYFAGDRGAELFYDVPNARRRVFGSWRGAGAEAHRFGVGPWRGPGANMNIFARESHIDVMAAAAGLDPVAFRLRNISDARMRRVLQAAAEKFGWRKAPAPSGRGQGVALGIDAGTYVALMAEVVVDATSGDVQVRRVVCAQDMGLVVNPEGATMQVEGCITMGLGYVLREELRFKGGEILDRNFDSYDLPRFSWLPRVETVLVANDALAPQGGGEPAIVPMGAVIANAVFDATGARLFRLPLTKERVREALASPKPAAAKPAG